MRKITNFDDISGRSTFNINRDGKCASQKNYIDPKINKTNTGDVYGNANTVISNINDVDYNKTSALTDNFNVKTGIKDVVVVINKAGSHKLRRRDDKGEFQIGSVGQVKGCSNYTSIANGDADRIDDLNVDNGDNEDVVVDSTNGSDIGIHRINDEKARFGKSRSRSSVFVVRRGLSNSFTTAYSKKKYSEHTNYVEICTNISKIKQQTKSKDASGLSLPALQAQP